MRIRCDYIMQPSELVQDSHVRGPDYQKQSRRNARGATRIRGDVSMQSQLRH